MTEHEIATAIVNLLWQNNMHVECEMVTYDDGELGNRYYIRGNGVYLSFEDLGFKVYAAMDIFIDSIENEEE